MPTWSLFRRAAGIKNRGAFRQGQTRQIQFLEHRRWHGRNLRPMFVNFGCESASFTDFPIGSVVLELKREEFESEDVEFIFVAADVRRL